MLCRTGIIMYIFKMLFLFLEDLSSLFNLLNTPHLSGANPNDTPSVIPFPLSTARFIGSFLSASVRLCIYLKHGTQAIKVLSACWTMSSSKQLPHHFPHHINSTSTHPVAQPGTLGAFLAPFSTLSFHINKSSNPLHFNPK